MSALSSRRQSVPSTATSAAGQEEPIQPVYTKNYSRSPISAQMQVPRDAWNDPGRVSKVDHRQRTVGMRYLYARGMERVPIQPLGAGAAVAGPGVWDSAFQPNLMGPIHDAGFNDRLYQAGFPGFNLGLSFKTQQNPSTGLGGGSGKGPGNIQMQPRPIFTKIQTVLRPSGAPGRYQTKGAP